MDKEGSELNTDLLFCCFVCCFIGFDDAASEAAFAFDDNGTAGEPVSFFAVFVPASPFSSPFFAALAIDFHFLTRALAFGPNAGCFLNFVTTFPMNV